MWTTNGRKLRYGIKKLMIRGLKGRLIETVNLPTGTNKVLKKKHIEPPCSIVYRQRTFYFVADPDPGPDPT